MSETIVRTGTEAEERLQQLGLSVRYVEEAVRAGVEARRLKNEFEPRSASGLKDWIARVGALRWHAVSEGGWCHADPLNMPLVYQPGQFRALGVVLGDKNTGNEDSNHPPRSKYPKGPSVAEATRRGTQTLPVDVAQPGGGGYLTVEDLIGMDMWFLVTRVDEIDGEFAVQREVSLAAPIE